MEEARGDLKGFLDSRAASKAAKTRAETKVSAWEAKLAMLREEGAEEERIRWGEANLRKAKAKVAEKQEAIEGFDRAVKRSERELAAVVARVKDEKVDEVVEVDVEGEMEEAIVKEEEEEETKVVVAAPAGGGGGFERVAQGVDGVEGCGGYQGPAMGPNSPGWPPPPQPGQPPPRRPGESGMDSPGFVGAGAPPAVGGGGGYGWTGGGGVVHLDKPLRLGVVEGSWGWQRELPGPGKRWGEVGDPPERGVKMFEFAQTNILTPERKKGGGTHWRFVAHCWQGLGLGGVEWVGKAWVWTPTCSALLDFGGSNPEAANRGCMPG